MAKRKKKSIAVQWERVSGPNLDPDSVKRGEQNKNIKESEHFQTACSNAGIEPTLRQASKFRRKKGLAFRHRNK